MLPIVPGGYDIARPGPAARFPGVKTLILDDEGQSSTAQDLNLFELTLLRELVKTCRLDEVDY